MHHAAVSESPECGVGHGRIPRSRWPRSLLEVVAEDRLLELQEARQHGTHQLSLVTATPGALRPANSELSFDHDDTAATLHVGRVHVAEQWRSHGLARGLYDLLHELRPRAAVVDTELSPKGQRLVSALPPSWNQVRPQLLVELPLECTGPMIDPVPGFEVRLVHAANWCPVHECDCGIAEDQNLLDDEEELVDRHLDGEPFDPWWPHESFCGVRFLLPRQGISVVCGCWHSCRGAAFELDAAMDESPASAAVLLHGLTSSAQQRAVSAWVTGLRKPNPAGVDAEEADLVDLEDTWAQFVSSALHIEAGALPGCVIHPRFWGPHIARLCEAAAPEHGYLPRCCGRSHTPVSADVEAQVSDDYEVHSRLPHVVPVSCTHLDHVPLQRLAAASGRSHRTS